MNVAASRISKFEQIRIKGQEGSLPESLLPVPDTMQSPLDT